MAGGVADAGCTCGHDDPEVQRGVRILAELTPVVEENMNRHLSLAQEWMPHEYVPWGEARDFSELPWEPGQSPLSEEAQIAFEVNLLTEDNLPSYHRGIAESLSSKPGAIWMEWLNRWTAEEARHSIVMRDYLMVCRGVDPVAMERARMAHMSNGWAPARTDAVAGMAYVSFQELATRISHRNTGRAAGDPVAEKILSRVATDENLHMVFYRNLVKAGLEIDASAFVVAIEPVIENFQMPGTDIPDFLVKAMKIANAGIYDMRIHHDDVLMPVLRHWKFFDLEGLDAEAEQARERIVTHLAKLDTLATRYEERRAARAALTRAAAS